MHRGADGSSLWCWAKRCWGRTLLRRGSPGSLAPAPPSPTEAGGRRRRGSRSSSPLWEFKTEVESNRRERAIYLSQILSFMCSRTASYFERASSYMSTISSTCIVYILPKYNILNVVFFRKEATNLPDELRAGFKVNTLVSTPGGLLHWKQNSEGESLKPGLYKITLQVEFEKEKKGKVHLFSPHIVPSCLHSPCPSTLPQPSSQSHSKVPSRAA